MFWAHLTFADLREESKKMATINNCNCAYTVHDRIIKEWKLHYLKDDKRRIDRQIKRIKKELKNEDYIDHENDPVVLVPIAPIPVSTTNILSGIEDALKLIRIPFLHKGWK